jgi:hypothetical protein
MPTKAAYGSEFGEQPIPVVGFDYDVKSYDTDNTGTVNVKHYTVSPQTPNVGDSVLVAMEMGSQSLPRCVGVIQGKNWIIRRMRASVLGFSDSKR